MPASRNRPHLLIQTSPKTESYTPHPRGGGNRADIEVENRQVHAANLSHALHHAMHDTVNQRKKAGVLIEGAKPGFYIEFQSKSNTLLKIKSLGNKPNDVEVLAVRSSQSPGDEDYQQATVFVPERMKERVLSRTVGQVCQQAD